MSRRHVSPYSSLPVHYPAEGSQYREEGPPAVKLCPISIRAKRKCGYVDAFRTTAFNKIAMVFSPNSSGMLISATFVATTMEGRDHLPRGETCDDSAPCLFVPVRVSSLSRSGQNVSRTRFPVRVNSGPLCRFSPFTPIRKCGSVDACRATCVYEIAMSFSPNSS